MANNVHNTLLLVVLLAVKTVLIPNQLRMRTELQEMREQAWETEEEVELEY